MRTRSRCHLPGIIAGASLILACTASATTIHVPGDQPTIQQGIDATVAGDTVLVAPGTYSDGGNVNLNFNGKDIVLCSSGGPEVTIIDPGFAVPGIVFENGETAAAIVDGFTILRGHSGTYGGGVSVIGFSTPPSPTIRNCIFTQCEGCWGAGVCVTMAAATIENCRFDNNHAWCHGGGVAAWINASLTVVDCTFVNNWTHSTMNGGGLYALSSDVYVEGCTFIGNWTGMNGGGLSAEYSDVVITGCTFSDNCCYRGGGIYVDASTVTVDHTIITFSEYAEAIECSGGTITLSCTDLYGNEGGDWTGCVANQLGVNGNFSADPLYCNRLPSSYCPQVHDYGDLSVDATSPCAPGNTAGCGLVGALPVACDATAVEPTTWGLIKASFRQTRRDTRASTKKADHPPEGE